MIKPIQRKQAVKKPFKFSIAQKIIFMIAIITLAFIAPQIAIILAIGLLPTFTVLLTDSKKTDKLLIVGCFNMTGIFVCMMDIFKQYSLTHSVSILSNVFNIIIMLGAAALGMIIYYELPNLFVMISKASVHRRLRNIDDKIEKLTTEWGSEIIQDK
ncbi:MAG: hypothetical protein E7012_03155 [Alphaproteobacteria bacterium]|nr:hypothetical protein [Alphaproteobacteria bacterium]